MDGIYRPTLESVLQSNGEVKNTVLIKDGRTYVDIEMIWSFIDGTIQTNIENNPSLEAWVQMRWVSSSPAGTAEESFCRPCGTFSAFWANPRPKGLVITHKFSELH